MTGQRSLSPIPSLTCLPNPSSGLVYQMPFFFFFFLPVLEEDQLLAITNGGGLKSMFGTMPNLYIFWIKFKVEYP